MVKTIRNKKVAVFENLRRRIIDGSLPPGFPLSEGELAGELGVSKTPVREALRQLERDSLVVNVPGRGSMVAHISSTDISEIFEIREIVECGVARRAASLPDKAPLMMKRKEIQDLAAKGSNMAESVHEWGSWEDVHLCIVNALGNRKLTEMYLGLMDRIQWIRNHIGKRFTQRRFDEINREHLGILDAVIDGDAERADRMVQDHLRNAVTYVTQIVVGRKG